MQCQISCQSHTKRFLSPSLSIMNCITPASTSPRPARQAGHRDYSHWKCLRSLTPSFPIPPEPEKPANRINGIVPDELRRMPTNLKNTNMSFQCPNLNIQQSSAPATTPTPVPQNAISRRFYQPTNARLQKHLGLSVFCGVICRQKKQKCKR